MRLQIDRKLPQMRSLTETCESRRVDVVAGVTEQTRDAFITPSALETAVHQYICCHSDSLSPALHGFPLQHPAHNRLHELELLQFPRFRSGKAVGKTPDPRRLVGRQI